MASDRPITYLANMRYITVTIPVPACCQFFQIMHISTSATFHRLALQSYDGVVRIEECTRREFDLPLEFECKPCHFWREDPENEWVGLMHYGFLRKKEEDEDEDDEEGEETNEEGRGEETVTDESEDDDEDDVGEETVVMRPRRNSY